MTKIDDTLNFITYTDAHLSGTTPTGRSDDFPVAILKKVDEIYAYAREKNVMFVLFMGDLFNTFRIYSYEVINQYLEIIEKYQIKTYFIIGQHDLYGYNKDHYNKSTLCFVEKRSNGLMELIDEKVELENCIIYASHVDDDIHKRLSLIERKEKFQIVMAHCLLTSGTEAYDVINIKKISKNNVDLVLSGDLHAGYELIQNNGTVYYNPGALARCKNNDVNRKLRVKCGLFNINGDYPSYNIKLQEYQLKTARPAEEIFKDDVFDIVREKHNTEINVDKFVEEISKFESESVDIFELIHIVNQTQSIPQELIQYIMKFKKEGVNEGN